MRTSKTVSISLPPAQLRQAEKLAKKEHRTMSELVREALRLYQEKDDLRRQQLAKLHQVLEQTRADAERRGAAKITNREIEAEIAAHRYERRHKKIRQPA